MTGALLDKNFCRNLKACNFFAICNFFAFLLRENAYLFYYYNVYIICLQSLSFIWYSDVACFLWYIYYNKDENVHRFALSSIRGELLEREKERETRERERKKQHEKSATKKSNKVWQKCQKIWQKMWKKSET